MRFFALSFVSILFISGCASYKTEENTRLVIEGDTEYVEPALMFALYNSVYQYDLNAEVQCQVPLSQTPFTKITTAEAYETLKRNSGCDESDFPEIDFRYYFLVFGGIQDDGTYDNRPQAVIHNAALGLFNIPENFTGRAYTTEPFSGWLMIGNKYVDLPLKLHVGDTIEF